MSVTLTAHDTLSREPAAVSRARRRRLRIAFVVHDYNRVLGHSRYVAELAERFARDHEVHVYANTFDPVPAGITPHRVPALRGSALLSIFSFVLPASAMIGGRFDIVHAQGFTVLRPDIVTAHISNARWLRGRRELEATCLSWRERLFGALVIPAERRTLANSRVSLIAVSAALRNHVAADYGRNATTDVIPHGVDRAQFNPSVRPRYREKMRRELGIPAAQVLFLYVGDLRKGFASAVRALAEVPDARLLAVSRTPPQSFLELADACGVRTCVAVHPPTDRIERYYAAADAVVLPTPYDAFGMVITEAMACGLPVITTPLAGASELLREGVHGLLVKSPTDVRALAASMQFLACNPDARSRMGIAAAELAREHTWDRVAERTLAVYYKHLDSRRRNT